jgi:predicted double-glycine peptidase
MRLLRPLCAAILLAGSWPAHASELPGLGGVDYSLRVTSIKQARQNATLMQQYDFSCGSAALATLLTHHYGYLVTEQVVFEDMYARGDQQKIRREGFSLLDMKRFLEARGFLADGFELPLEKLMEAGVPAIVLVSENGYHHFVVVKGLQDDRVLVGDPASGTRAIPRSTFEANWKNRLLFVIHNRMETARFNLASDWRVAPRAPLAAALNQGMGLAGMPKMGPGDF